MSIFEGTGIAGDANSLLTSIIGREAKDFGDVQQHEERVADAAAAIAAELGMHEGAVAIVKLAARLHDVGKMLIPLEILRKPGMLSPEERTVMETHASKGAEILSSIRELPPEILDAARYHHERYDGLGYEGLSGEQIPYIARIIAVADVFDALSSKRDYKPAMPEGEVLSIMAADLPSGRPLGRRAFDPVVLRTFVGLRLAVPQSSITDAQRSVLTSYANGNPMDDLSDELLQTVHIDYDGVRALMDDDGVITGTMDKAGTFEAAPSRSLAYG